MLVGVARLAPKLAGQLENVNMEDDDLEQLLDEVEKKFCSNVSVASSAQMGSSESVKCGKESQGPGKHR